MILAGRQMFAPKKLRSLTGNHVFQVPRRTMSGPFCIASAVVTLGAMGAVTALIGAGSARRTGARLAQGRRDRGGGRRRIELPAVLRGDDTDDRAAAVLQERRGHRLELDLLRDLGQRRGDRPPRRPWAPATRRRGARTGSSHGRRPALMVQCCLPRRTATSAIIRSAAAVAAKRSRRRRGPAGRPTRAPRRRRRTARRVARGWAGPPRRPRPRRTSGRRGPLWHRTHGR